MQEQHGSSKGLNRFKLVEFDLGIGDVRPLVRDFDYMTWPTLVVGQHTTVKET
jgi:hypothetical protein